MATITRACNSLAERYRICILAALRCAVVGYSCAELICKCASSLTLCNRGYYCCAAVDYSCPDFVCSCAICTSVCSRGPYGCAIVGYSRVVSRTVCSRGSYGCGPYVTRVLSSCIRVRLTLRCVAVVPTVMWP